jgi:serine O-acetyltransferase
MNKNEWFNTILPTIVEKLQNGAPDDFKIISDEGLDLAGRSEIYEVLDDILSVLFPVAFGKERIARTDLAFHINDILRHVSFKLGAHIREVFKYRCKRTNCDDCDCETRAEKALMHLIESLPHIREMLLEDIKAAYEGDPAATSYDEIILSYPCVDAIATYRIAHLLYGLDVPIIPRIMSERAHSRTGIDIHPGAKIGSHFFIDHGTGVVIGETCTIGSHVKIYQGVTLGALSPFDKDGNPAKGVKRHPDIEDNVIIYANATILGGHTLIGKGAVIGGNTFVTRSVAPGAIVGQKEYNFTQSDDSKTKK